VTTAGLLSLGAASLPRTKKFYSDDPLWSTPAPAAARHVAPRKISDYYDFVSNTFRMPGRHAAHHGEFLPSEAINTVDEVPGGARYTSRRGRSRMGEQELKAGPGNSTPPAEGRWTVIAAKSEGVTPGFRIRDGAGREYFLKFDPLSNPEMASAADVITS